MTKRRTFVLRDVDGDGKPISLSLEVVVEGNELALLVRPKGFGDCNSADGHGTPILLENRGGVPFLVVWSDVNQEDPTHVISLGGAAESRREE